MAKIKRAEHIQDIRGGSKNHVYSDWKGRGYLRSKSINPSNPRSSAQAALRSSMPRYSHLWSKTLTEAQRALWNEYAQREGKIKGSRSMARQIIPPPGVIGSGFNMFVRNNILLQSAGIQVPPAYLAVPPDSSAVTSSPTNLAGVWNYGWGTRYSENLEDEINNATPNNWTPPWVYAVVGNSELKVSTLKAHSSPHSCRAQRIGGGVLATALIQQNSLLINQTVLSYSLLSAQADRTSSTLYVTDAAKNLAVGVALWSDSNIKYNDGGVWKIACPYVVNVWSDVKVTMHDFNETYDLSIDGNLIAVGISYAVPGTTGSHLYLIVGGGSPINLVYYVDDILIRIPITLGFNLTWTDPLNAPVGSRIRVWLRSYGMSAHLQQVDTVALGEEALILSQIRTAQGHTVDISNLPGEYKIQLDSVSPEGRQSAPSNVIEVNVP